MGFPTGKGTRIGTYSVFLCSKLRVLVIPTRLSQQTKIEPRHLSGLHVKSENTGDRSFTRLIREPCRTVIRARGSDNPTAVPALTYAQRMVVPVQQNVGGVQTVPASVALARPPRAHLVRALRLMPVNCAHNNPAGCGEHNGLSVIVRGAEKLDVSKLGSIMQYIFQLVVQFHTPIVVGRARQVLAGNPNLAMVRRDAQERYARSRGSL